MASEMRSAPPVRATIPSAAATSGRSLEVEARDEPGEIAADQHQDNGHDEADRAGQARP